MDELSFSILQLIEESKTKGPFYIEPQKRTLELIPNKLVTNIKNTYYEMNLEKSDDSFWFYFDFGRPDVTVN